MLDLPETVVFDLDGTLVDTAPDLCAALNFALARLGRPLIAPEIARDMAGQGARRLLEKGLAHSGEATAELIEAGLPQFLAYYAEHIADHSQPYPGVEAALDALAAAGCRLAICTNKPEPLARALVAALGWGERFAAILGFYSVPFPKPDPRHLLATIAAAGGNAQSCIYVGDSITDTQTARAASVPMVVVGFGFSDVPAHELDGDAVIDHFDDLLPALRALVGKGASRAGAAQ